MLPRWEMRPVTQNMRRLVVEVIRSLLSCTLDSFQVRIGLALCAAGVSQPAGPVSEEVMAKVMAFMEHQYTFDFDSQCRVRVDTEENWRERVKQGATGARMFLLFLPVVGAVIFDTSRC